VHRRPSPEADVLLLAAPQDGDDASDRPATDGAAPARVLIRTLGVTDDDAVPSQERGRALDPIAPGAFRPVRVALGAQGWTWVGWADRPLAAWQEWRTDGAPGEPRGRVASRCLPTDPAVQSVLGLRTDGGNQALLQLANPFAADATFAVTFTTATEVVEPVALRNVSVPGGTRVTVRVNDHVPEQAAVAATVTVGAGRLAVEGLQQAIAELEGHEGLAAIAPIGSPATTWSFPWVSVDPDDDGALWVLNPEPRPVSVQLTVHTAAGATVPDIDRIEVAAGALVRLRATDLAPAASGSIGVTLRSETTGILATGGATFRSDDLGATGLVRFGGASAPDASWSIAGLAAPDRTTDVHVLNLGEAEAVPRITVTSLLRPDGGEQEDATPTTEVLTMRPIPPGAIGRMTADPDWGPIRLDTDSTPEAAPLLEGSWLAVDQGRTGRPLAGWVADLAPSVAPEGD